MSDFLMDQMLKKYNNKRNMMEKENTEESTGENSEADDIKEENSSITGNEVENKNNNKVEEAETSSNSITNFSHNDEVPLSIHSQKTKENDVIDEKEDEANIDAKANEEKIEDQDDYIEDEIETFDDYEDVEDKDEVIEDKIEPLEDEYIDSMIEGFSGVSDLEYVDVSEEEEDSFQAEESTGVSSLELEAFIKDLEIRLRKEYIGEIESLKKELGKNKIKNQAIRGNKKGFYTIDGRDFIEVSGHSTSKRISVDSALIEACKRIAKVDNSSTAVNTCLTAFVRDYVRFVRCPNIKEYETNASNLDLISYGAEILSTSLKNKELLSLMAVFVKLQTMMVGQLMSDQIDHLNYGFRDGDDYVITDPIRTMVQNIIESNLNDDLFRSEIFKFDSKIDV